MVVDQVGAKGEGETSVVVMENVVEGEALANLTNELLDNAFAAADLSAVCGAVAATSSAALNDASRRRLQGADDDTSLLGNIVGSLALAATELMNADPDAIEQTTVTIGGPIADPRMLDENSAFEALDMVNGLSASAGDVGLGSGESSTADAAAGAVSSMLGSALFDTPEDAASTGNGTRRRRSPGGPRPSSRSSRGATGGTSCAPSTPS